MRRCFIFAAGSFYGLRERPVPGDLVIAADAGYRICRGEGIVPDLLLGDFDSMEPPAGFAQVRRLPVVEGGKLVGVISLSDLARSGRFGMEAAQALSEISENIVVR